MNFSFLPEYWDYFNYGAIVTLIIEFFSVFFCSILVVLL
ncbi:amino acid ABC transporter permease, partial [Streptococcus suis]